ncbi:hypothetical protein [Endozoicomonas sp. ISHI1]|uniref:hypothetical protein n=1 Tax=Endozoicomonas sp. ISHI1 TaxID=2825882 RepID=UPI002147A1E6|nr:hypothetical protein [Endozoicomonas sp. ISHI1]
MEISGRSGSLQIPASNTGSNAPLSSDGNTPTHRISGPVNPDPQLNQLQQSRTPDTPINERRTDPSNPLNTPGLRPGSQPPIQNPDPTGNRNPGPGSQPPIQNPDPTGNRNPGPGSQPPIQNPDPRQNETPEEKAMREAMELETMSEDQLNARQKEKLDEAAKVSQRYEEFDLLSRAKDAMENPKNAPKDLKVTIAFPGKEPVTLIPWDDKLMERDDFQELWDTAKKVLAEHETTNFANYNPKVDKAKLDALEDGIRQIAHKLGDNEHEEGERDHDNKWEKRWKEVRHKPVRLEAFEGLNRSNSPRVVAEQPRGNQSNPDGPGVNPDGPGVNPDGPGVNPDGPGVNPDGPGANPNGPSQS